MLESVLPKRFSDKVDFSGCCWEWKAHRTSKGYGQFSYQGKVVYAHRFSWKLHNGQIPKGLFVCHKCDNPPCVNPDHLFLGTLQDNADDMCKKGRVATGEKHGNFKLQQSQVDEIRRTYRRGERGKTGGIQEFSQYDLARRYGVGQSYIKDILKNRVRVVNMDTNDILKED